MQKKRHTAEQIIAKLREAEVVLAQGEKVPAVCRKLGITEQTYYRWRKEYGGLKVDQAKHLKELEKEIARLRKAVTNLTLDNQILERVSSRTFRAGQAVAFRYPNTSALSLRGGHELDYAVSSLAASPVTRPGTAASLSASWTPPPQVVRYPRKRVNSTSVV